ncbi:hypothetical protein DRO61_02155 [Candidatus Bathyarchaeota archaeon]|nr:MAG: hypothetical protein DRO61_02155 [Candidatus Bathyarchaeota archaeon]
MDDYEKLSDIKFVTGRQMLALIITIAVVLQLFSYFVNPTAWINWQLLVFITSTNLGAVILAILAQNSADEIAAVQRKLFTPSFYRSMNALSKLHGLLEQEAQKKGHTIDEEIEDLAPKLYGLFRAYVDVKASQEKIIPPDPIVEKPPLVYQEDELFLVKE